MGRETLTEYATNELDLLKVKQKNGASYDLLRELTYNSAHRPLTYKDAAAQTTTFTYNTQGQLLTLVTPPRTGITESRTTAYSYDTNGYLQSVAGPATGATTSFTYDSHGRRRTITDSDGYTLTFDYDALDRQTKVAYPDSTFEESMYERLDPVRSRDRLGRWTHSVYDALRRVIATTDRLGRTVTQQWCSCGSIEALVDANGNRTEWERDIEGRVTKEIRANGSEWLYVYENTSSRLKRTTDAKGQHRDYAYTLDDNIQGVSYPNPQYATSNVSFTFEAAFNRVATMVDGTGTTVYGYHPIGATPPLGAAKLASVNGPLANDTITYAYDELGRLVNRAINGVALTYEYDALGRIITENNVLGPFSYQYDGVNSRLRTVTYPNGQTSTYAYYPNSGDHRLQEIHHKKSGVVTLSKFNYTYDAVGNIKTWTQQQDTNPAKAYDFEYDRADQLRTGVWRTTDPTPSVKRHAYMYDSAGNRTVEQIDNAPILSAFDNMNRLTSQAPGGTMRFAGTLSEAATVTVQSLPATVTAENKFERGAQVSSGTSQVIVKAKDYAGNERTNTYEVSVSGSSKTITFDANGNVTSDGTRTFTWDAENRLLSADVGNRRSEFYYDGQGRRVRIVEKESGLLLTEQRFLWCGLDLCSEMDGTGNTVATFLAWGEREGSSNYYYTRDHIGSLRELTDESGSTRARYTYDPYGNRSKVSGDLDSDSGFTGHFYHPLTGLLLTANRSYSTEDGRWTSADSPKFTDGTNLYWYVYNNPIRLVDPLGLFAAGIGGGVSGSFGPPTSAPTGDALCAVVADLKGNVGLYCCAGVGVAVGNLADVSGGPVLPICPTCDTICDMNGDYVQFTADVCAGGGGSAGGGVSIGSSLTIMPTVKGCAGASLGVSLTTGSCKIVVSFGIDCDEC
ncbi:MAG: RHS repeat domain-containing protein [Gammaproteobacteria bacterium]